MTTTKKLSKEELREDKVATAIRDFSDNVQQNLKWVVAGVAAVVILIVAVVLITQTRARAEENASANMAAAQTLFFGGDYAQAQTQFQAISGHYGSTRAARLAPLFLGNCQLALGVPADAEQSFRKFLSKSGDDPAMRSAALRGLGASLADQGNAGEAAEEYERAASIDDNQQAADDWMSAGQCYGLAGRHADAGRAYRVVIEEHPESPRAREARLLIEEHLAR